MVTEVTIHLAPHRHRDELYLVQSSCKITNRPSFPISHVNTAWQLRSTTAETFRWLMQGVSSCDLAGILFPTTRRYHS